MGDERRDAETFLDALVERIRDAGSFNRNDKAAPAAVVWTDHDRQWEPLLPRLRERLPLLTFGPYAPAERTGPAYWIRCMLAGTLPEDLLPIGETPILYLPGVSRQELRAVEECPRALQPLAELQYRGVLWTQKNGRDWSIAAFLQSADGGLGIETGADSATREALQRALLLLADEPASGALRREAPLRAPFFDALLNPDPPRRLLRWLNDPKGYRAAASEVEWASFRDICRLTYDFDPQLDGELSAAERLGRRDGAWETVWQRYDESPRSYSALPSLLQRARPPQLRLFETRASWPQDNQTEEARLRDGLHELARQLPDAARTTIQGLESEHGARRAWVWSRLDQTPLANALEHLATLATQTSRPLGGPSIHEIGAAYAAWGWQADAAVLDALAAVERSEDLAAVSVAISALYRRWLEDAANTLQHAVAHAGEGGYLTAALDPPRPGTCLLFSDGLRYDVGRRLATALEQEGLTCELDWQFTALPSITSTAKPAVSPVASHFRAGQGLNAASASGAAVNLDVLRRTLEQAGYQFLRGDAAGDPTGRAWTELGDIDAYGHEHGWKLAHQLAAEIRSLSRRIVALLDSGWDHVVVVTDHGWLLLPDALPKAELPEHLTEVRKGRCARLKDSAATDQQTAPWYWNTDVRIAMAPGICCYEAGKQYEHGGLSPQECVVPVISVTRYANATTPFMEMVIEAINWRGLRCSVKVAGAAPGTLVDIRTRAADAATSLATAPQPIAESGAGSLIVPNDDRIDEAAFVVVLAGDGTLLAQALTKIGG